MISKLLTVLIAFMLAACEAKVGVVVYYETLCPDSMKFITTQLYPSYMEDLREYVNIELVPYGKTKFVTLGLETNFTCQHGPNECYGNKVHACAIAHIQGNSYDASKTRYMSIMKFINCLMNYTQNFDDNVYPTARCANETGINGLENIEECANKTEGSTLLRRYGERTNHFQMPLESVPTVVFQQQTDTKISKEAVTNFRSALCSYMVGSKPKICAAENSAAISMALTSLTVATTVIILSAFI